MPVADMAARLAAAAGDATALLTLAIELLEENAFLAELAPSLAPLPPPPTCRCARLRQKLREAKKRRHTLAGPVTPRLRYTVLARDGLRCVVCKAVDRPLHVDHILPVSRGGLTVLVNLQTLCDLCNSGKGDD